MKLRRKSMQISPRIVPVNRFILPFVAVLLTCQMVSTQAAETLVGQPVDIASSAYQYRADRKADENPPESWFAVMHVAKQPLNTPVDLNSPVVKQVLSSLLWEEI